MEEISIKNIFNRFRVKISFTFVLMIIESVLEIFYPLLIGLAINDLIDGKYDGVINLTILGVLSLVIGSARRFYDTRIYSKIYSQIATEMVQKEHKKDSSLSKITARSNLLTELIEFFEDSLPAIIGSMIALVGISVIIFSLNLNVFYACLGVVIIIVTVYSLSGKINFRYNSEFNTQLEKQVDILKKKDIIQVKNYFDNLMQWNIKLSDLEVVNYFAIWLGVIALFVFTPISVIDGGVAKYGLVFAIFMYVLDFVDNIITFPIYIQELIRLKEISVRLSN